MWGNNGSWDLIYHVLRANFDGVSSEYVDAPEDAGQAKYEYGFNVTGIKYDEKNEEVVVSFTDRDKNERNERTDRVFAADGPSSTIRGLLLPSVKREYAGYVLPWVPILMIGCMAGHNCRESSISSG